MTEIEMSNRSFVIQNNSRKIMESKNKIKNVFVWGAFDILHEGHINLFKEASKLGNLFVILSPDEKVSQYKYIIHSENERRENLSKIEYIKEIYLDTLQSLKCFGVTQPDIFCFGYDQNIEWADKLKSYLKEKFPLCELVTMEKYGDIHSSNLRGAREYSCGAKHSDNSAIDTMGRETKN